jgi:hypothetical protein
VRARFVPEARIMNAALQPLRKDDLHVGRPAPYSIYDRHEKLLLAAGCMVESELVLTTLREDGWFRPEERRKQGGNALRFDLGPPAPLEPDGWRPAGAADTDVSGQASREATERSMPLDATGVAIGDPLQLQFRDDASGERYPVRLIGALEKKTVLVTHPAVDGRLAFVKEGSDFRCRGFHGRYAYWFDAAVTKVGLQPYAYLHLTYPLHVSARLVRRTFRVPVRVIATLGRPGDSRPVSGTIRDLSAEGARFVADRPAGATGELVELGCRVTVEGQPLTFRLPAALRSLRAIDEDGRSRQSHGLQLVDLPVEDRRMLQVFVYETLEREGGA